MEEDKEVRKKSHPFWVAFSLALDPVRVREYNGSPVHNNERVNRYTVIFKIMLTRKNGICYNKNIQKGSTEAFGEIPPVWCTACRSNACELESVPWTHI